MEKSALQKERAAYQPKLPKALQGAVTIKEGAATQSVDNQEEIKKLFPNTYGMPLVEFVPAETETHKAMNVGVILSGGQAPGGHNVISGLFDEVKKLNPENRLYGFLMGPGGLVDHKYIEITDELIADYRNTGGFDLIGSGRTKLEEVSQFEKGIEILRELDIKALVIIGGDDSNTNACVLAEYYAAKNYGVQVIGCPKTIDGDLKNDQIETSFGFDTACKTYAEVIGNIERDCNSARKYWHFIKLMGRSASHIALECALQTQPNICLISEEIEKKDLTLNQVVEQIAETVAYRASQGNNFGVVLIPEGLIEFIPAIGRLIQELNDLLAAHGADYKDLDKDAQRQYILLTSARQTRLHLKPSLRVWPVSSLSTVTPTETCRYHSSRQRNCCQRWLATSSLSGRKRASTQESSLLSTTSSATRDVALLLLTLTPTTATLLAQVLLSSLLTARQATWPS